MVNQNSSIPPNQIGFKKGSRTSDHVLVLKPPIDKYINRAGKSYLYVWFIDFSAAFDTVWEKYGENVLQLTSEYCYLGIIFVPSGSFAKAETTKRQSLESIF